MTRRPIAPCLWFDGNAEEAANYYISVFPNSRMLYVGRFGDAGPDPDAPVVFVEFELNGQPFQAVNGGPEFTFTDAVSFSIECADQAELDYYWNTLTDGGEPGPCGWLKDRYGLSWQVVPRVLLDLLRDEDRAGAGRVMRKMLQMTKLNIDELKDAYRQDPVESSA